MWNSRVVVPEKFTGAVMQVIHAIHSGVVRMKALARQKVRWPSMDKAIEHVKKSCLVCQQQSHEERKVRLHPCWETPERPWQRIHVDLSVELSGVPCGWS